MGLDWGRGERGRTPPPVMYIMKPGWQRCGCQRLVPSLRRAPAHADDLGPSSLCSIANMFPVLRPFPDRVPASSPGSAPRRRSQLQRLVSSSSSNSRPSACALVPSSPSIPSPVRGRNTSSSASTRQVASSSSPVRPPRHLHPNVLALHPIPRMLFPRSYPARSDPRLRWNRLRRRD